MAATQQWRRRNWKTVLSDITICSLSPATLPCERKNKKHYSFTSRELLLWQIQQHIWRSSSCRAVYMISRMDTLNLIIMKVNSHLCAKFQTLWSVSNHSAIGSRGGVSFGEQWGGFEFAPPLGPPSCPPSTLPSKHICGRRPLQVHLVFKL